MTYTKEELTKKIEEEKKLAEQWSKDNVDRYAFEGPHHREVKRLNAALALVKLGVNITGIYNGIAYIETSKGEIMQYALITGKFKLTTDRFWLDRVNKKSFVANFLNRE